MAKKKPAPKVVKKSASKPASKSAKKPVKTSAKPVAKKSAKGGAVGAPGMFDVSTGSGATPIQVGQTIVQLFNQGKFQEIEEMYWSPGIESIEGFGVSKGWRGIAAVAQKGAEWMADHVIHGASAEGPFVGATGFAIRFRMDVETKSTGAREMMDEVGVYTVKDGKIAREEFMYFIPAQG